MPGEGSILSGVDAITKASNQVAKNISTDETTVNADIFGMRTYTQIQSEVDRMLSRSIDGSTRLIGAPHQFLAHNDNRFGNSKMGRMYAEKIIMEAPVVYIQPGVSEFLPGENSAERQGFAEALASYSGGDATDLKTKLNSMEDDVIQYFGIKEAYSEYMAHVNMMCRILATFLGIADVKVPWTKGNGTFATYDWRAYRMKSQYGDLRVNDPPGKGLFNILGDFLGAIQGSIANDYEYIQFYITPDASYSQSFSNQTTSSVLENMTDQLSGVAKELQTVMQITGAPIGDLAERATSSLQGYMEQNAGNGPIATLIKRITGAANQVIKGGNFILPEIWNNSSTDGSFSFKCHLVTPYGNKLAWYINIGVPLMFLICLALPLQQTANVISSPYLFKCFSPGWFTSSMCMIDSMSLEKASDGVWNKAGLPNDITVNVSVKDLYSSLSLPKSDSIGQFMANTGMLEFLMTTAGVDISHQKINTKWEVWKRLFENKMLSIVQDNAYDISMAFKHHASGLFKILK